LPKYRHLGTIADRTIFCPAVSSQQRHASTVGKNLLNGNISSMSSQSMANFIPLTAEIGSGVWGTPADFNGFRVLPSLLQQCCSLEANQTLHDVWPSPGLVHYIYIFGGSAPLTEFCPVQYSLYVQVLRSPVLAVLLHGTPAAGIPLPSNGHHPSSGDCLEGKGENYQVCSVQYCVQQLCTVRCTHI